MDALEEDVTMENNNDGDDEFSSPSRNRHTHQQLRVVFSQVRKVEQMLDTLRSKMEENQRVQTRRHNQLNTNVKRIVTSPVVRRQNNDDGLSMATLLPHPKSIYILWEEWHSGVGGRKPAKSFTRAERGVCKYKYHRRKVVWDKISEMVRSGLTSDVAIDRIYEAYGNSSTVSAIINRMRIDRRNDSFPDLLRV